jgi:ribosomal protein L37AE/L43A
LIDYCPKVKPEIDLRRFLETLDFIPLDREVRADGVVEEWYQCHACREPTAHVRHGDETRWLIWYCETCGQGGSGPALWAARRNVHEMIAVQQMKVELLGHVTSRMREQARDRRWREIEERVLELYAAHTGSTYKFVENVLAPELGVSTRTAWRYWERPAVQGGVAAMLESRIASRESPIRNARDSH